LEDDMTTLAVRHTVNDFDTWRTSFDGHASIRSSHGATGARVLHDGNAVLVLIDFPDAASVQAFMADPSLAVAMAEGGVVGAPDVSILVEAA
jgi:hypothetical protein